jgi:ferredoxin
VDCIHWVDYERLKALEIERRDQVISMPGAAVDSALRRKRRARIKGQ